MIGAITERLIGGSAADSVDTGDGDDTGLPRPAEDDDIAIARDVIGDQLERAEAEFEEAWEEHGDFRESVEALWTRHGFRTALAGVEALERSERSDPDRLEVCVDSRTIREACDIVLDEPEIESIVYLSGMALDDGIRTINRVLEFEHEEQSAVTAVADPDAQFAALDELDRTGHQLLGHLHNHPGPGRTVPEPSGTDLEYQRDLEALGYDSLGFIVTQNGWLRAFSADQAFDVTVHGDDINTHDRHEHTFKIRDI